MNLQEFKVLGIIDQQLMYFITRVETKPTGDFLLSRVGVNFRFTSKVEANLMMYYNMSLGVFYDFTVETLVEGNIHAFVKCADLKEVNKTLNGIVSNSKKLDAGMKMEYECQYCLDGSSEFGDSLFHEELMLGKAMVADIEVYIGEKDNFELLISNAVDEVITKQVIKIKYCPNCGRKLCKDEDNNKS